MELVVLRGGLRLLRGEHEVPVPEACQRVLGYLAIQDGPTPRSRVAGSLWSDTTESRATANLRTCIWRLKQHAASLVDVRPKTLSLCDGVTVDLQRLVPVASTIVDGSVAADGAPWRELVGAHEVLEGWSEDWVYLARERFRQLRLLALESLARSFADSEQLAQALECAQAALATDPLRESAQSLTIRIHIRQGNRADAVRQFEAYRGALHSELGLRPSASLCDLVAGLGRTSTQVASCSSRG